MLSCCPVFVASSSRSEGCTVVALSGELDCATEAAARRELDRAVGDVVVDLGAVTFMGADGVGALLDAQRRVCARGGRFRLARPTRPARRVFALAGDRARFEIAEPAEIAAPLDGELAALLAGA